MRLWDKEGTKVSDLQEIIHQFTAGNDLQFDLKLAKYDVIGNQAQARMLRAVGLLTEEELELIEAELKLMLHQIHEGKFIMDEGIEDIHSQVEYRLTCRVGEAGKKIHAGRSRNDQILLDIKLFLKDELRQVSILIEHLFDQLLNLSEEHKHCLLPGYTHLQLAMPSSFGLWFGAYAESLADDMELLLAAWKVCDKNPLGSAAGYGSSFPVDRELTTNLMGFGGININSVYAQMSRGKTEKSVAFALAGIAATLSKLAYDIVLYMNQNFGFVSFPDELTTGSSIMPHKKNPDVFELIRAKCNLIQALPNELTLLTSNLPSGYHRDMQLTKEVLFPALDSLKSCLRMSGFMLEHIQVHDKLTGNQSYQLLYSVEEVNRLVLKGMSFRDAYKTVGKIIEDGSFVSGKKPVHTHLGSMNNLGNDMIREQFIFIRKQILE